MPRTNRQGKRINLVLQWLLSDDLKDSDLADALSIPPSTYTRRKNADDFPTYEELQRLGEHFRISPKLLQIAFGLRDEEELVLLTEKEMHQYEEQGGTIPRSLRGRMRVRADAPPLH